MSDIVQRLRERAYAFKAPDPLLEEAADEIERLRNGAVEIRESFRLTDAEREAIERAIARAASIGDPAAPALAVLLESLE
jgi:hypothetical protein